MEPLMTSDEVATYLRVDVVTIRRLVNRGDLAAYRVGGEYRFTQRDLEEFLKRQRVAGGEEARNDPLDALAQMARKFFSGGKMPPFESARDRFDRFTKRARKVLELAQEEARGFGHNYIGTEHLLLGLVREGEGLGAQVLKKLGVELEVARSKVEFIIGHGDRVVMGEVGLTPRAKKVIELSMDEAQRLNHRYIGTEHLLLGLIREGEGIAAGVLESLGVKLSEARAQTIEMLSERGIASAAPEEAPVADSPPPESASLVGEGQDALVCDHCGARNPTYFRHCFNCGILLVED